MLKVIKPIKCIITLKRVLEHYQYGELVISSWVSIVCVSFLKGVRNTCWSHIARVTHQVFKDKQRQAVLECILLNLWLCWTAAAFLLPLGFLTNWPPAKGREPKGNRRVNEPLRMWLSENRMVLVSRTFVPKVFRKTRVKTFTTSHLC